MPNGYDVVTGEIRRAAEAAGEAADVASGVGPDAAIRSLTAALPGSLAARSAVGVGDHWRTRLAAWVVEVRGHERKLTASAALYEANEAEAAAAFRGVVG